MNDIEVDTETTIFVADHYKRVAHQRILYWALHAILDGGELASVEQDIQFALNKEILTEQEVYDILLTIIEKTQFYVLDELEYIRPGRSLESGLYVIEQMEQIMNRMDEVIGELTNNR